MKATFVLPVLLLALSPFGYAQPVKVTVVPVESAEDFRTWLGKPVIAQRAAAPATYPGTLKLMPFGKKTQLPILVTGLPLFPGATRLVADVEILDANGRSLGASPKCCQAVVQQGTAAVLLNEAVVVEPESTKRAGSYTVNVSVTDGLETWKAREVLPFGETDVPSAASEAPKLRMNVPPGAAESTGDRRDCLSLPTPAEVIKCSEKR